MCRMRDGRDVPPKFSEDAIQYFLSYKALFKLPLRQTAGMVVSLLPIADLDYSTPCHTAIVKCQAGAIIPIRKNHSDPQDRTILEKGIACMLNNTAIP